MDTLSLFKDSVTTQDFIMFALFFFSFFLINFQRRVAEDAYGIQVTYYNSAK